MSDESAQIRILAVDDHALIREGIAVLVATQPDMALVAEAKSGREAIQQFRAHRPDITLMDLQMPEMNGLDAITAIRAEFPDAKIIVLTTYKGDVQILRAMKAGAKGYLLKTTFHKELVETIRAVHAGRKALSPEASYEIAEHATDDALTPAEISSVATDRSRQCKQANRGSALDHRGNRQESSQVHPFQVGRQRSNPRRHDWREERDHRAVVSARPPPRQTCMPNSKE